MHSDNTFERDNDLKMPFKVFTKPVLFKQDLHLDSQRPYCHYKRCTTIKGALANGTNREKGK